MKKILSIFFILLFTTIPCIADDIIKTKVLMNTAFSQDETAKEIEIITFEPIEINDKITLQESTPVKAEIVNWARERRWHRSGFILCKLKSYTDENNKTKEITDDIYLTLRRYEKIHGKDAALTGTEIAATTTVDVFLPGVGTAYYFIKGAIQREKYKNWFKSGVSTAYDNSIFWFWLKGKPVNIAVGDYAQIKEVGKEKALKLNNKLQKKHDKIIAKAEAKEAKAVKKQQEESKKLEEKLAKQKAKGQAAAASIDYPEE